MERDVGGYGEMTRLMISASSSSPMDSIELEAAADRGV